jgi:S1 RNA binding domain protein
MGVEVGTIVEGTVVKLLPYGVVVKLGEGVTGLVHISEIDDRFVKDVNEYFRMNDPVEVKVIGQNNGRIELSVKQARPRTESTSPSRPRFSAEELSSFEDRLSSFMKQSNERQLDVRRNRESKLGGRRR